MRSHQPLKYIQFDHRHLELLINIDGQWVASTQATIRIDTDPQTRCIREVTALGAHGGIEREEESDGK